MSKKTRKAEITKAQQPQNFGVISPLGKKIMILGIGLVVAGFFLLTRTDPLGQNLASFLTPFFLLGGYGLVAVGIVYPDHISASPKTFGAQTPNSEKPR